jgi:hypothetical protein
VESINKKKIFNQLPLGSFIIGAITNDIFARNIVFSTLIDVQNGFACQTILRDVPRET